MRAQFATGLLRRGAHQYHALRQLQRDIHTCRVLLGDFIAIGLKRIAPGGNDEFVAPQAGQREFGLPPVIAQRPHAQFRPIAALRTARLYGAARAMAQGDGDLLMPVEHHVRADGHGFAGDAFHGKQSAIHRRRDRFDGEPWPRGRFQRRRLAHARRRHGRWGQYRHENLCFRGRQGQQTWGERLVATGHRYAPQSRAAPTQRGQQK